MVWVMHLAKDIKNRNLVYAGGHVPYNGNLIERAREMRRNPTDAESKIWNSYLRNHELKFIRQKVVDHYIVDFYCPRKQPAIEIDGHCHDNRQVYNMKRSDIISAYGVKTIRVTNNDVMYSIDTVIQKIEAVLKSTTV